jgi:hypothetical protein
MGRQLSSWDNTIRPYGTIFLMRYIYYHYILTIIIKFQQKLELFKYKIIRLKSKPKSAPERNLSVSEITDLTPCS